MYFYSRSTGGFYLQDVHGDSMPSDVVEITNEEHAELMTGQSAGKVITADRNGRPILVAPSEDTTPSAIRSEIAARRYQAEIAGITVNEMHLPTDRASQGLVTGAALQAVIDSNYSCQWKTEEGFIDLGAQQIIGIASTMRAHVQACFDREAALLDALAAGTYTGEQLDQGWPV